MAPTALPPLDKIDPVQAWRPWEPSAEEPFNLKWAGHLYRRATFGGTLAEMRRAEKEGLHATLDRLIAGEPRSKVLTDFLEKEGEKIARRNNVYEQRAWWLYCMLNTGHPVREKMTLFWHNHFATSITKVHQTQLMMQQNELLRKYALGKFGPFLLEMSKNPAMLLYLDSNDNVKAHPNENYAREVMELFSLGVGNYIEKDVREAARAFTGWHTDGEEFEFNAGFHDNGPKTLLGATGNWDGPDVVRILLQQKSCARFLVRKLYRTLISENQPAPDVLLEPLCEQLRQTDYDIAVVLRTMLASRHFFSAHAFHQRIKSPVEFALGATRAVAAGMFPQSVLVNRLGAMGQELFAPPNVKGWTGAQAWLNTSTILTRQNFGQALAMGTLWNEVRPNGSGPFEAVVEVEDAVEVVDLAVPGKPGDKPKTAPRPSRPEEPVPVKAFDAARVIHEEKATNAAQVVRVLIDTHLPGGVSKSAQAKLVAFLEAGKPVGPALDRRVREAVHAIMCMPEYQLA